MYANYMYLSDECLVDLMKFTSDEVFEDDKTIYESVKLLKEIFKNKYPKTKLKPMMKSIHYANGFKDGDLKQSAYVLDEIQQYLTIHKFLNHDDCVEFFNKKITEKSFVITPESLFKTHLESLLYQ